MHTAEVESRNDLTNRAIDVLTQTLSDENVLLMKLRNCHWNVAGPHFRPASLVVRGTVRHTRDSHRSSRGAH